MLGRRAIFPLINKVLKSCCGISISRVYLHTAMEARAYMFCCDLSKQLDLQWKRGARFKEHKAHGYDRSFISKPDYRRRCSCDDWNSAFEHNVECFLECSPSRGGAPLSRSRRRRCAVKRTSLEIDRGLFAIRGAAGTRRRLQTGDLLIS